MSAGADKPERATPKRRDEARRRGQVAKSMDLNGALVLLAGLLSLSLLGPHIAGTMESTLREGLTSIAHPQELMSAAGLGQLFSQTARAIVLGVAPIAGVCLLAGVVANVGQSGLKPATQALVPDPRRMSPVNGARNIFGTRMLFEGGKSLVKVGVVGAIVALALIPQLTELAATVGASPAALGAQLASMVFALAQRAALAYLLIGAIDYGYQRWRHEKSLRMSKEELREEFKGQSLPAEVKGAQRRRQLQQARARMMAAVPQADVVVVNPTHFAVALEYDGSKPAPECVAKGQDLIALQIRRLAEEAGVPVIEDRPLARSLHASIEVGQLVPEELFQAVAQVLAYVYRVARRRAV
jgi:flagellar biosynthetic protein FlhB